MMQCTDFEKQVIAEAGVLSQEQQKHLLACKSCQDFLRVYGLALAPPAPSAKLDAAVRRQVAGVMRWQRQRRRLIRFGQALLGAAAVLVAQPILPYALAFAAGAMIFVVAEDLIPEGGRSGNLHIATTGVMLGFAVMMLLDVALG